MNIKSFNKLKLPDKPGVYFFMKGREILYIGKATSLRDRVKSYFGKDLIETRGPIILDMVFKADKIKWQITDSVLEALILEANLIKKHQPKYNTKEKSDKSFNYVCITKEKLPRVVILRGGSLKSLKGRRFFQVLGFPRPKSKGLGQTVQKPSSFSVYYGPYPNGSQLREALKIVRRIFPFLDEKSKNYMEFYRQINLVPDLNDKKLYLSNIKNIKLFFSGKKKRLLGSLKKEMRNYARNREFEKAGEMKRQIFALKHVNDIALIKREHDVGGKNIHERTLGRSGGDGQRKFSAENFRGESGDILPVDEFARIEAYDIAHLGGKNMVGVMTAIVGGEAAKNEYRKFKIRTQSDANDTGALKEVLERRLKHEEWNFPDLIVVDGGNAQINAARTVLKKNGLNIPVVSVVKDERHKPKAIMGATELALKYKEDILLANSEAHRFAISYYKKVRGKNFLK